VSKNQILVQCTPAQVFAVLADGWSYAAWVVGAARIRDVDESWPQQGSVLHHSVGTWPVLLNDTTTVVSCEPNRSIVLRARAWPGGEATVVIELEPAPGGTHVTMREDAVTGPAKLIPSPIRHTMLSWRNTETLKRLALLAEGRATGHPAAHL
jgi:hypothetical protein